MPRIVPLIFVSSTSEDLAEFRSATLQSFPAIDALYRGMEFFGARPDRPKNVIQRELGECDLYVGIIGHRYGSTDEKGVSFTEFEYHYARRQGKPRLVFIADPNHSVRPNHVETDPVKYQRLVEFKRLLMDDHVVKPFSTADDLVAKILDGVRRWISEHEESWKSMRQAPLAERENDYIRKLYSGDPEQKKEAIRNLKRPDCRPALEHFYGLLCHTDVRSPVVQTILDELLFFADDARVSQILLNLINDRTHLREQAVKVIDQRAFLRKTCPDSAVTRVLELADDDDMKVRLAVAHALKHVAVGRGKRADCKRALIKLKADPDPEVQACALRSLRDLSEYQERS